LNALSPHQFSARKIDAAVVLRLCSRVDRGAGRRRNVLTRVHAVA
jgi:hypothetical protein